MNHTSLKDKIIVTWLDLDPDQLAADVPVEESAYGRWETLATMPSNIGTRRSRPSLVTRDHPSRSGLGVRTCTIDWNFSMPCARREL